MQEMRELDSGGIGRSSVRTLSVASQQLTSAGNARRIMG